MKSILFAAMAVCLSSFASAGVWAEVGDATDMPPGQVTVGTGSLDLITGHLDFDDADMYCIHIVDPAHFSASTVGLTGADTQLFLFNSAGFGVTMNDDAPGGGTFQSTVTGAFVPGPGIYMLAISGYDHDPLGVTGGEIWADGPFGAERAPDGPAAGSVIAGWGGPGFDSDDYGIHLTGVEYCRPVPEPTTMAVLGLGALALIRRRRNRA